MQNAYTRRRLNRITAQDLRQANNRHQRKQPRFPQNCDPTPSARALPVRQQILIGQMRNRIEAIHRNSIPAKRKLRYATIIDPPI